MQKDRFTYLGKIFHVSEEYEDIVDAVITKGRELSQGKRLYFESADFEVRGNAALALIPAGDERAVAPLIAALQDDQEFVKVTAGIALKRITGQDFGQDYEKWKAWYEQSKGR